MAFCSTARFRNGTWQRRPKRVFSTREEAEPYRKRLEKAYGQPCETYRCPKCFELHIGRTPLKFPDNFGSGNWNRLTGQLVKSLRKVLDKEKA